MGRNERRESPTGYYHVTQRGYVFQGRFHSEPIQDESYLLSCVRYIHNNPLKAGLADRDKYRWSSYNEYVGVNSIVDNKIVMEMFENRGHFEAFSAAYDERIFYDIDDNVVTCSVGKDIIRKHYGTEFENTLIVKQLRCEERNSIIREMKAAGLSNHQIELITGVSRSIVAKIK